MISKYTYNYVVHELAKHMRCAILAALCNFSGAVSKPQNVFPDRGQILNL